MSEKVFVYSSDVYCCPNLYICSSCKQSFTVASAVVAKYCPLCGKSLLEAIITTSGILEVGDEKDRK